MRFAAELWLFLAARHRADELRAGYDGTSSLGHVIQSLGVPLTEVGRLLVEGREVPASYRPLNGAVVRVCGIERPQPLPQNTPRFVLDVHLGSLARRLRLLGVDTAYANDLDDDALLAQANTERRVLLTQDRGLLGRRALWLGGYVRGSRGDEQLADVLGRFAPPLAPWTRCPACNGEVVPVAKDAVAHLLRPGTRRTYDDFARCPACGHLYWRGAHHRRLQAIVDTATRTVAGRCR
jgi:uncharacterized protein with PIN domain